MRPTRSSWLMIIAALALGAAVHGGLLSRHAKKATAPPAEHSAPADESQR